jgi:hypothetical protein
LQVDEFQQLFGHAWLSRAIPADGLFKANPVRTEGRQPRTVDHD